MSRNSLILLLLTLFFLASPILAKSRNVDLDSFLFQHCIESCRVQAASCQKLCSFVATPVPTELKQAIVKHLGGDGERFDDALLSLLGLAINDSVQHRLRSFEEDDGKMQEYLLTRLEEWMELHDLQHDEL
eukprot:gnl/Trimastix_PCT/3505.p1 GENE.gnl/Trimastix_PCT/3505~~gnl/Trimastix_PCT/3505.p1  ORF type:complete len:131 (+),score=24.69 gnl/Trimastix_PCT/3505:46-438(+)